MNIALVQIDGRVGADFEATETCIKVMPTGFFTGRIGSTIPKSKEEYSKFIINELPGLVTTDHVLIIQSDGFITNPECWMDDFLNYDFIGAPWPFPPYVGNGGFSLRSRKLLEACRGIYEEGVYEDVSICCRHRQELIAQGIKFAPLEVAAKFSRELVPVSGTTFGFYGSLIPSCICGNEKPIGKSFCSVCFERLEKESNPFSTPEYMKFLCAQVEWLRTHPVEAVA